MLKVLIYIHKFEVVKNKWNISGLSIRFCKVLVLRKHDTFQLLRMEHGRFIRPFEIIISSS